MDRLQFYGGGTINSSNIDGTIRGAPIYVVMNGGKVDLINITQGGTCIVNKGTVNEILLGDISSDINLTIGNMNDTLNTNNPQIGNIALAYADLYGITTIFNFYNGIINKSDIEMEENSKNFEGEYNIRPGYKAQKTTDGIILVKE